MKVKPNHPLRELLGKLLFSIETVPATEQRKMVNRACKEAVHWHECERAKIKRWVVDFNYQARQLNRRTDSSSIECPECERAILYGNNHADDCELKLMISIFTSYDCIGP